MKSSLVPWLTLFLVVNLTYNAFAIQLQSSTFVNKQAHLIGNTYDYVIYEAQFDEEIYVMRQWACECVDNPSDCPLQPHSYSNVTVDESQYYISVLEQDTWYNNTVPTDVGTLHFKFNFTYNPAFPCPILIIDLENMIGAMSMFVSNTYIPTQGQKTWYRPYYAQSTYSICPSNPYTTYGVYYITFFNQDTTAYNSFLTRWRVINSPTCSRTAPTPPADPAYLIDGQAEDLASVGGAYYFYKFLIPGPCSNFTVSAYVWGSEGDPDIYASTQNPYPNSADITSYAWLGTMDGDDFINAVYCNPNSSATTSTIYIGLHASSTGNYNITLIATSKQFTPNYPLSSLAYLQSRSDLSFGTFRFLNCPDRTYTCAFTTYFQCDQDVYLCCYIFTPVPLGSSSQPLWPWPEWDTSLSTLTTDISWSNFEPIVTGKLAFSFKVSETVNGVKNQLAFSNAGQCTVSVNTNLVDGNGNTLPSSLSFSPKPLSCDYDTFVSLQANISSLITSMSSITEYNTLGLAQLNLNLMALSDTYYGCKQFVSSLASSAITIQYENTTSCRHLLATPEWYTDPCCNYVAALTSCCATYQLPVSSSAIASPNYLTIKKTCGNPTCANSTIVELAKISQDIDSDTGGCDADFNSNSGVSILSELIAFIDTCRLQLVGADLLGAPCQTDSDCGSGISCIPTTLRCNATDDDVLTCLSENIDQNTAIILLSNWGVKGDPTPALIKQQMRSHFIAPQCYGPTGILYRNVYTYTPQISGCVDPCLETGAQPVCFDMRSPSCVVPDICGLTADPSVCYRYWEQLPTDLTSCISAKMCNWMDCDPTDSTCIAACTANSTGVCVDCTNAVNGQCLEVLSITDTETCNLGICSIDPSITDPVVCNAIGTCSLDCPTCDTYNGCVDSGSCSDNSTMISIFGFAVDGYCLYAPSYDNYLQSYVCDGDDSLAPNGCVNGSVFDPQSCTASWIYLANTSDECNALGSGCYNNYGGFYLYGLNETECNKCDDIDAWTPFYTYTTSTWTNGQMNVLLWQNRTYASSNVVVETIDYGLIFSEVESAIATHFTASYMTQGLCHFNIPLQLMASTACDCGLSTDSSSQCYASQSNSMMGQGRTCPYMTNTIETQYADLQVYSSTLNPDSDCQIFSFYYTPPAQFKLGSTASVSQALFQNSATNDYWIVKNNESAYIGQITSGAVKIDFGTTLNDAVNLCITLDSSISIASVAQYTALAYLDSSNVVRPLNYSSLSNGKACLNITASGTYFAAAVVKNYATATNRASQSQYYVAAALYLACIVFGVIQAILLTLDRIHQRIFLAKLIFIGIIVFNCVVRSAYVLLPPNTFGTGLDSIGFIIFEFPTFLIFSVITVIMYLWFMVVIRTHFFGRRSEIPTLELRLKKFFVVGNACMYFVFCIFIWLIAILPAQEKASPCFFGNSDTTTNQVTYKIKLAYWIFQAVVVICVSFGFSLAAVMVVRLLVTSSSPSSKALRAHKDVSQIIIISTVAGICIVFSLVRSLVFLWSAATGKTVNVILFAVLELIPQLALLFYVDPWNCFKDTGRSSSVKRVSSNGSQASNGSVGSNQQTPPTSSRL